MMPPPPGAARRLGGCAVVEEGSGPILTNVSLSDVVGLEEVAGGGDVAGALAVPLMPFLALIADGGSPRPPVTALGTHTVV